MAAELVARGVPRAVVACVPGVGVVAGLLEVLRKPDDRMGRARDHIRAGPVEPDVASGRRVCEKLKSLRRYGRRASWRSHYLQDCHGDSSHSLNGLLNPGVLTHMTERR